VNSLSRTALSASFFGCLAITAAATAAPSSTLDDACWTTSFLEPFDELNLASSESTDGWTTQYIWDRNTIINQELQYYVDPRTHEVNPFSIDEGVLTISAIPTPNHLAETANNQPYLSGVLTSRNWFEQQYGRFDVRAQVPKGQGLWSAFWMLPTHKSWPEGIAVLPELDIMEHLGHQVSTYHTTLHSNQTGKLTSHPYDHNRLGDLTDGFHLYSAVWTESEVSWYLDGKLMASHPSPEDFNHPKHFLLNLAVGGSWPGSPNSRTRFPANYRIDFVRAMNKNTNCD